MTMTQLDNRSLIERAANRGDFVTLRMVNGDIHQGRIKALDVNGAFVQLSSDERLLINLRHAVTVEIA